MAKHLPFNMLWTFQKLSRTIWHRHQCDFFVLNMNSPSLTSERQLFTTDKEDKVTALPPSHLPLNTGNPCSKNTMWECTLGEKMWGLHEVGPFTEKVGRIGDWVGLYLEVGSTIRGRSPRCDRWADMCAHINTFILFKQKKDDFGGILKKIFFMWIKNFDLARV